jgi:hypothetical protein
MMSFSDVIAAEAGWKSVTLTQVSRHTQPTLFQYPDASMDAERLTSRKNWKVPEHHVISRVRTVSAQST